MALWNGLGLVATVAQLTGVDASGLITMILEAVRTVSRNREECRHLARRVMMIGDLLQKLQGSDMMQDSEIRRPLDGLDDTLREAYVLVASCQDCSLTYRFLMGWKQAEQFREVQRKIDSYIQLYPFISHIDITRRLDKLCNSANPSCSQIQAAGQIFGSSTSHANPDLRTGGDGSGLERIESQRAQKAVERYLSDEHQQTGFSMFHFSHLKAATNNFSFENEIGHGGFGIVYKGQLRGGLVVAIKRCISSGRSPDRCFEIEVELLMKLQHINIVKLLGYCTERGERILVYAYIPNGGLDKFIFGTGTRMPLDWSSRFRIIVGMAQGVVYLHEYCGVGIVHRDLKPSNVLLDSQLNPKIIDFGIAGVLGNVRNEDGIMGTLGYVDPEYCMWGQYSLKTDVYSFGVILLEIITAKRSLSPFGESPLYEALVKHAWEMWRAGRSLELIDPSLHNEPRMAEILRCLQIALLCVEPRREDRPTMPDVIVMLSSDSASLPSPKRRGFEDAQVEPSCSTEQTQPVGLDSDAQQI